MKPSPPKYALQFLRWFCRVDYLEEFEGDLLELFEEVYAENPRKARWKFTWEVLRHFRVGFIKSFYHQKYTNSKDMLRHHLLLAYRNIIRYKASFLINLIGLSTGLAATLLILIWVNDELSVDQFHQHKDRLYQVMRNTQSQPGEIITRTSHSDLLVPTFREELPEIEHIVAVDFEDCAGVLSVEQENINAKGAIAGKAFFRLFSYPLLAGHPDQVLTGPDKIVISDELATSMFGTVESAINGTLTFDHAYYGGLYKVSGVFQQSGYQSSEEFDFLIPHDLYMARRNPDYINWGSNAMNVYLSLRKGMDQVAFGEKIRDFVRSRFEARGEPPGLDWVGQLFIRPYAEKYLHGRYENGRKAGGRIEYVWLFSLIAFFILLIASINFMNLSTAQASRKLKQVGIKKVVGVNRETLVYYYLAEALSLCLISFLVAMVLVLLFIPSFNTITGKDFSWILDGHLILVGLAITVITALFSGAYPAFYLSGFKPIEILKGRLSTSLVELWTRKGLVIFQFSISILLIVAVVIVYQQVEFVQSKHLGYSQENMIAFDRREKLYDQLETFVAEVNQLPGVESSTAIEDEVTDISGWTGVYAIVGQSKLKPSPRLYEAVVGYDFIETLSIEMKQGRPFSRQFGDESSKIVLNELAVETLGLVDPIGTIISWKGEEKEVIGVTKNFHGQSLYEEIKPMAILHAPEETNTLLVKIKAGTTQKTIAELGKLYKDYYAGLPFEFRFVDEQYRKLYLAEQRVASLCQYFATIAIILSCLGLFGLVAFAAERRVKEIGIRKVLGATNFSILSLLSKEFLAMVLVANLIALPLSYHLSRKWLSGFAYSIQLSYWYFVLAGITALFIAGLSIGLQLIKTTRVQPVECLRDY